MNSVSLLPILISLSCAAGIFIGVIGYRFYVRRLLRKHWTGNPQSLLAQITQDRAYDVMTLENVSSALKNLSAKLGGQADDIDSLLLKIGKSMESAEAIRRQLKFSAEANGSGQGAEALAAELVRSQERQAARN